MPENKYVVSAKARADLKAIAKYIIEKLGEGQSLNYAQGFKTILADLGNNPELGKRYVAVKDKMLSRCRYKSTCYILLCGKWQNIHCKSFGRSYGFSKTP
ncbi:type II toxin-antitoxin system RelE/ParE family toxin [Flagellimonas oceanensis]|uniref:type II toxin-antitoxin system RelE/ParE family toxin n=1 Tax=Flagellimonas oceanensis TaxID=2499163 RepID=UPI003BAADBB6